MKQPDLSELRRPPYIKQIKRNWVHRNPRLFQVIAITTSMLIFFSRPLYDAFIRDDLVPPPSQNLRTK